MEKTLNEIVKKLLKRDKSILAIFIQGSSTKLKLDDYSDIDLIILCDKKPKKNFYVEIVEINHKKILIDFTYRRYDLNLNPLTFPISDLVLTLESLQNSRILYDKKDFYKKFKSSFEKPDLVKKQISTFPFYFNILIDGYYKTKRLYRRKDYQGLKLCARHIADKSLKLINSFNEVVLNKNLYNNPRDLKTKPENYDKYFYIVAGLDNTKSIEDLYYACIKLIEGTILFINKKDLIKIKDMQFHKLLDKILKEIK